MKTITLATLAKLFGEPEELYAFHERVCIKEDSGIPLETAIEQTLDEQGYETMEGF